MLSLLAVLDPLVDHGATFIVLRRQKAFRLSSCGTIETRDQSSELEHLISSRLDCTGVHTSKEMLLGIQFAPEQIRLNAGSPAHDRSKLCIHLLHQSAHLAQSTCLSRYQLVRW